MPSEAITTKGSAANKATGLTPKSGTAILQRNPFDSVTGPLDGKTPAPAETKVPTHSAPTGDPYDDTDCAGIRSSLITATEDPAWSFASLSSNEGEKLHRIGDKVGTFTVAHIGYYESEHHDVFPRVWLTNAGSRCIVGMGAPEPSQTKPSVTTPKPTSPKNAAKEKIQNEVKSKIKKVGENQFEVDRSGVELIIKNYAKLAGSLRSRPTKEGMRVSGIKQDDILSELGMKTGDMLQSINGFDMTDPDKAVDAYAKLRKAGQLDIQLTRDGAPITIGVKINK
ncbi:MAG: general secretion pathway protein GspC [Myxococcales bacterium]|nr:general secretion pathway protein GspC [Myxococcales bacterium]